MPIEEDIDNLKQQVKQLDSLLMVLCQTVPDDKIARIMSDWSEERVLDYLHVRTGDHALCLAYGDCGPLRRVVHHNTAAGVRRSTYTTPVKLPDGDPVRRLVESLNYLGACINID